MPQVIVTAGAVRGLERCRLFLTGKNPFAAAKAAAAIRYCFKNLETMPAMGRPHAELPELRGLLVPFGDSGYVALYRYEPTEDVIYVLAFRHQKEAGY